jgi:hypothetical protein
LDNERAYRKEVAGGLWWDSVYLWEWCVGERQDSARPGMNCSGTVLRWGGGVRLIALAFAMMTVVAFAIVLPALILFTK